MKIKDAVIRVVDCETTGLEPKEHKVTEIACVDMNYDNGIISSTSSLINPEREIPITAMVIHHITDEMVKDAPKIEMVWPSMQEGNIHVMAAHNAKYDFSFLKTDKPILCSLRLARHLWPDLESHSNQYLRYYLKVKVNPEIPIHRALGDATITALILQKMMKIVVTEKGIDDIDALIKWIEEPVLLNICRFGNKHKGQKWSDVPRDYLQWMKEKVNDMDIDTGYTVDYYLNHKT